MNEVFPKEWVESTIADINFHKSANVTPKQHPDEIFELYSVPIFPTRSPEIISGSEIGSSKQVVEPGDVLLCKINPRINRVWDVYPKKNARQIASSEWIVVRQPNLDSNYLRYFLSSQRFRNLLCSDVSGVGGSLTRAQPKKVATYTLPLPPLAEQKEIALRLDDLLAQVDSIKTRLDALPAILKRFRQSTLAAATSGKLTEQWRASNQSAPWKKCCFGDLVETSSNGLAKRRGDAGDEITVLRLADFKDAKRVCGKERQIRLKEKECDKYILEKGDLLAIRVNGSADLAGLFILYDEDGKREAYCDHFIRFRMSGEVDSKFITYIANEGEGRHYLRNSLSTSAGQNTINQKSIKALPVNLPAIEEQTEIVRRVEELFAFADQVEQRVKDAQAHVNHLTQSILAKAFRGELTKQWRRENPDLITGENSAAALLDRIKAERAKITPKKRTRGKA